ncbi:P-loop containing nucleoside triphosphate hydrolase protein [Punctularia strigosozonata HHB-11173 SS5]|uniref:P-loop containing nucleoside triphosphate hydrolase protein n=1 Tax=Punctularia strigosozonata (strain HHB-11173) TaxID=741275 RepID=UPI00044169B1|nr:P-loop containing nucleoside triphosphate hydrolase protein [Punctularia strigosozonata HHB-11173 SS5]EIN07344.1 P-loop containing nucleoside triphosphate hydrolase protein [Punctularia strigosozonata HHB-11173 SS5]
MVLFEVKDLAVKRDKGTAIFSNVNFDLNPGDVVVLQGKSGAGKSTLLKALANLNIFDGRILLRGRLGLSPGLGFHVGVPAYRTRVQYVPQRPSMLPGTPRDFVNTISSFGKAWGIEKELWDRSWTELSGGESQRIVLAVAVGLDAAEVLLLDEPTSALDAASCAAVETYLLDEVRSAESRLQALIWVTHSEEQGVRVGTRFIHITPDGVREESPLSQP